MRSFRGLSSGVLGFLISIGGTSAATNTALGSIAYVKERPDHRKDIHLIRPDGNGDRVILTLPAQSSWPELSWKPGGQELAFSSDHAQTHSLYQSDLYTVQADGKDLRRITNALSTSGKAQLASVTVDVHIEPPGPTEPANVGGPFLVYVEGAPESKTVLASAKVHFDRVPVVSGRAPYIVVMSGVHRWIRAGTPLVAGRVNDLGRIEITGSGLHDFGTDSLSWNASGSALIFGFGECCVRKVAATAALGARGEVLNEGATPPLVAYAPTPAKLHQFLYTDAVEGGVAVRLANDTRPQDKGQVVLSLTKIMGLAWLPDGSGFVFTTDNRQITTFETTFAYRVSVSPDGHQIAFEYGSADSLDGLWVVNEDGSQLHRLVKDAGRPAWGGGTAH
jgi:hypothetical protein